MEGKLDKKNKSNNKLLVVLVSVMSVVTLSVLGVLGVVLYKGYASESDSVLNTVTKIDESTSLVIDSEGNGQLVSSTTSVDSSYHTQIGEYLAELVDFSKKTFDAIQKGGLNDQNKQDTINSINDFLIFSKGFNAYPKTDEDYIFNDEFTSLKYDAEMMAEQGLKYVHNKEKVHRSLHGDYFNDVKVHLSTLGEMEKRYY